MASLVQPAVLILDPGGCVRRVGAGAGLCARGRTPVFMLQAGRVLTVASGSGSNISVTLPCPYCVVAEVPLPRDGLILELPLTADLQPTVGAVPAWTSSTGATPSYTEGLYFDGSRCCARGPQPLNTGPNASNPIFPSLLWSFIVRFRASLVAKLIPGCSLAPPPPSFLKARLAEVAVTRQQMAVTGQPLFVAQ